MKPILSRRSRVSSSSSRPLTRRPSMRISPALGVSSPPIRFNNVDLPEPEGPTMETSSPRPTSRSTSSRAVTPRLPSKRLDTLVRRIMIFFDDSGWRNDALSCTLLRCGIVRIGIDTGGTFTDFVVLRDDGFIESFKLRSNPARPASVILAGLARIAAPARTDVVHGSTVATNALLERKGARTAFVTTQGFADLVRIGRQNRAQLYNLTPTLKRHLVGPSLSFGVTERAHFDGVVAKRPARA